MAGNHCTTPGDFERHQPTGSYCDRLELSDQPARVDPEYIAPLLEMLSDPEADARNAAMLALVAGPDELVLAGLKQIVDDSRSRVSPDWGRSIVWE